MEDNPDNLMLGQNDLKGQFELTAPNQIDLLNQILKQVE